VFYYLPRCQQKATLFINNVRDPELSELTLESDIPFIIDTRISENVNALLDALKPYDVSQYTHSMYTPQNMLHRSPLTTNHIPLTTTTSITYTLSFPGDILVSAGDKVTPDTIIAQNRFDPPLIYVVMLSVFLQTTITEELVLEGLLIREGDVVEMGDLIFHNKTNTTLFWNIDTAYSPVRGLVESINYATGTIILREIQDYPLKPIEVNVAKQLDVLPKNLKWYLKVRVGDFVYAGATLAKSPQMDIIFSPHTGTIKEIDTTKGTVTIQYDKKPFEIFAQCFGSVEAVKEGHSADISVCASTLEGKIGFSVDRGGYYYPRTRACKDCVTYCSHIGSFEELADLAYLGINGLIVNTISYGGLVQFLGADIGVALTGNEAIPFSIIILTGFSTEAMVDDATFFDGFTGCFILLKPKTQIRAGAIRPQVMAFGHP